MKLTGKAKEDFEKWLPIYYKEHGKSEWIAKRHVILFKYKTPSEQWGVIQDFADSVGYTIETTKGIDTGLFYPWVDFVSKPLKQTRPEARIAAIEKFNELYNKNHENKRKN